MDTESARAIAQELREIANELAAGSANCRLWADLKATNRHFSRTAAGWVHRAIAEGLIDATSLPAGLFADPIRGLVFWGPLRRLLRIDSLDWPAEYDRDDAPPKRTTTCRPLKPSEWNQTLGHDEFAEPGDFSEPLFHAETIDRTADELRQWHKEQSLARAAILETLAKRIERPLKGIALENRTIPMSQKKAAKYMGGSVKWLSKSIKDGSIKRIEKSRQSFIFDKTDFPPEVWHLIMPKLDPN